jgi:hypothetical protein
LRSWLVSRSTSVVASRTAAGFGLTAAGLARCRAAAPADSAAHPTTAASAAASNFRGLILFDITNPSLL